MTSAGHAPRRAGRRPSPFARLLRTLFVASLLVPGGAGLARADERDDVLALRAADLEAQGRCADAVALYRDQARENARVALVAGRCQVRGQAYADAVDTLEAARELPDAPADVDLQLGIAQYHLGELDAARASLDRARARGADGALLDLYSGLLQLQADDVRAAALSLERARRADPGAVEPVASYYAFLAWRQLDEQERAREALERLRAEDPGGPWIAEADRMLGQAAALEAPRFWADAEAGLEYDSNVVVRGAGVTDVFINGDQVKGKDDGLGYWSFDAGAELFRTDRWSGGLLAAYTGNAHFDISEFDTHYPTLAAYLDRHFGPDTTLRVRYDYGYAWVNYDPYLSSNTLSGTLFQSWHDYGQTELSLTGGWYDFKYDLEDPPTFQRRAIRRDGTLVSTGILHRYRPGLGDLELRGGYLYSHYASDGREFDYDSHRFLGGFDVTLPGEIGLDSWVAFTYQPFEKRSVYSNLADPALAPIEPKHRDRIWDFGAELEKFVTTNVSVLARYRYTDSGSNTDVYDYHRHVVGGYVRVRFR